MSKVYLAGPMSGIPAFNIPKFDAAATELRERGFEVWSPAEIDGPISREILLQSENGSHDDLPPTESWSFYLARDFRILADEGIQVIVTLPGWENSKGARCEVAVGKELGIPHIGIDELLSFQDWVHEQQAEDPTTPHIDPAETMVSEGGPVYDEHFESYADNPERQRAHTGAVKDNRSKSRVDLLPAIALVEVGKVLAFGAQKYKPNNWRLGLSWSQTMGSVQRHLYAFSEGEDLDPETGLSHVAHAACQILFLTTYVLTQTGEDDRWSSVDQSQAGA